MHEYHDKAKHSQREKVHSAVGHTQHYEHMRDKAGRLAPPAGTETGDRMVCTVNGITVRQENKQPGSTLDEPRRKTLELLSTPVEARTGD